MLPSLAFHVFIRFCLRKSAECRLQILEEENADLKTQLRRLEERALAKAPKNSKDIPTTFNQICLYIYISNVFNYALFTVFLIIGVHIYIYTHVWYVCVQKVKWCEHISFGICLSLFYISMLATRRTCLETHVVGSPSRRVGESPRPSRSRAEHQWWQDWGGKRPAAFPAWPHPTPWTFWK